MNILSLILNAGKVIDAIKSLEQFIEHLVKGDNVEADVKNLVGNIIGLAQAGLINVPGLTSEQLAQAMVKKSL